MRHPAAIALILSHVVASGAIAGLQPAGASCTGLTAPVEAPIAATFAPAGAYAGHWGVDFGVPVGSTAGAAASGIVTFAGVVAGNTSVTVDHGGGLKTSYSFLTERRVSRGDWVARGSPVGTTGEHDGRPALHFSVRVDGAYADPTGFLGCRPAVPAAALRLVPVP